MAAEVEEVGKGLNTTSSSTCSKGKEMEMSRVESQGRGTREVTYRGRGGRSQGPCFTLLSQLVSPSTPSTPSPPRPQPRPASESHMNKSCSSRLMHRGDSRARLRVRASDRIVTGARAQT